LNAHNKESMYTIHDTGMLVLKSALEHRKLKIENTTALMTIDELILCAIKIVTDCWSSVGCAWGRYRLELSLTGVAAGLRLKQMGVLSYDSQCTLNSLAQTAQSLLNIHYNLNPSLLTINTTDSTKNSVDTTKNLISNTKNLVVSGMEFIGDVYIDMNRDTYSHSNGDFMKKACNLCKSVIDT
jgi:hypothetical protein